MTSSYEAMLDALEQYSVDPATGLIFSYLDRQTLRAPTDETFAGAKVEFESSEYSLAELYRHENFGMCTGSFMMAELLRHELDGDDAALAHVRRGFQALCRIYQLGFQLERGFFPKPYGGRFSSQTSTDQVLYACCALEKFHPCATSTERAMIEEMIPTLVDFWVKRDYRYHYFHYFDDNWQWPLVRFPALLMLAYRFSGDGKFLREYQRLLEHTRMPEHCQLFQLRSAAKPTPFEVANHGWLTVNGADRVTMDTMQFDILLRHDPENPLLECWRSGIRMMWEEVEDSIAPDGRYYSMTLFDFDTGKLRRTPGYAADGTEFHGAKSAWSTMVVRAGLQALRHCPELACRVLPRVECVLGQLEFRDCSYYDEPERFPPELRYRARLLSGDAVANWLWSAQLRRQWLLCQQPQEVALEQC